MLNNLGKEIPRVNELVVEKLIEIGVLCIGEDNQLHVNEKIPTEPTTAQQRF